MTLILQVAFGKHVSLIVKPRKVTHIWGFCKTVLEILYLEVDPILTQLGYYAVRQMSNIWYLILFFCDLNHNKDFKLSLDTVCLLYT